MKISEIYKMLFLGTGILALNSCVFLSKNEVVKNDPHDSQWQMRQEQQALAAAAANGKNTTTPVMEQVPVTPQPESIQKELNQQVTQTTQQATSTATTTAKSVTEKATQAKEQAKTSVAATTATTTTTPKVETPKPTVTPTTDTTQTEKKITSLQDITNENGYIPTAVRVPGDPTRVYNPLVPSKTIRILDKNGNVHPSGTVLKVKGTNYKFYVP